MDPYVYSLKNVYVLQTNIHNSRSVRILFQWPTFASTFSYKMCRGMGFTTMWYVRPAKLQISLRIRAI